MCQQGLVQIGTTCFQETQLESVDQVPPLVSEPVLNESVNSADASRKRKAETLEDVPSPLPLKKWIQAKELLRDTKRTAANQPCIEPTSFELAVANAILQHLGIAENDSYSSFVERFRLLVCFRMRHGHFRVPKKDYPLLGKWVENLRHQGCATEKHKQALQLVHFNWNARDDAWRAKYDELLAYKAKYGHCKVPKRCTVNQSLGSWVCQQRSLLKKVQGKTGPKLAQLQSRIDLLNEAGFCWEPGKARSSPMIA